MKINIILIALLYNLSSYSQINEQFKPGKIHTIYGQVTDKTTKDTLTSVRLEFMDKDYKRINATLSDFDGMYLISFCSNKLSKDTILIKATKAFYKQQEYYYKINSDTIINFNMTSNKNKIYTKEELERFERGYFECGVLYEDYIVNETEYELNKTTYRHYCSGEEKKYKSLIDANKDMSEWILIE